MNSLNIFLSEYRTKKKPTLERFDSNKMVELDSIGLNYETLERFHDSVKYCPIRKIPVFIYQDLDSRPTGYSYFSSTYKKHFINEKYSFFIKPTDEHKKNIKRILIFPDPIELLSYSQIHRIHSDTLLISPHPYCKLSDCGILREYYPNARANSLYPKKKPYDVLCIINLNFALGNKPYSITVEAPYIHLKIGRNRHVIPYENINYSYFQKLLNHKKIDVKPLSPPSNYYSFNEIINENN